MTKPLDAVRQYLKGWMRHDPERILRSFTKNGVYIDPLVDSELMGAEIVTHAEKYFALFPDLSFDGVGSITESNGLYAAQWIMRGTHSGLNNSASGKPISIAIPGADFMLVDQDKIRSVQAYYDHRMIPSSLYSNFGSRKLKSGSPNSHRSANFEYMEGAKYAKSALSSERSNQIKLQILALMEKEKPYLDSDLSLLQLANALGHSTNHVSQVINSEMKKNFNDFVNTYRIEEAKQRLRNKTNSQASILEIAFEVGFASKSTFNAIFKKHTRMTPSQYIHAISGEPTRLQF